MKIVHLQHQRAQKPLQHQVRQLVVAHLLFQIQKSSQAKVYKIKKRIQMELNEIFDYVSEHMDKSIEAMKRDFTSLRSGKVSTSIVENIKVDYYGNPTPLNQVASVIAQDATTISISPWEKPMVKDIEKAIQEANIGINPNNDGESVKLFFPPMTVEQRQEIAKQAKAMGEKAKVAIRNVRKDGNDKIKKSEKELSISEDEIKKALDKVQKLTDEHIAKVDELTKKKEDEILKVQS
eukprot:TRINITY_DN64824_c0_g1_i1.p8 TRINITY_DN64824_c0_g1~~TRINITY_DN64824_c0_g1_i1.p8  ORF type:complete len:236 (+),score=36.80 TRINITY_DN64824_c0_g1_i1:58-765(+)